MRKVEILPTRDHEAGYGPVDDAFMRDIRYTIFNITDDLFYHNLMK